MRAGLRRAQVVFEHPILFGICAGSALALTHMVLGHRIPLLQRWLKTGLVGATALLSLSSASIAAVAVQVALMMWSALFRKNRYGWRFLWFLFRQLIWPSHSVPIRARSSSTFHTLPSTRVQAGIAH